MAWRYTKEFTQERLLILATSVGNAFLRRIILRDTDRFTNESYIKLETLAIKIESKLKKQKHNEFHTNVFVWQCCSLAFNRSNKPNNNNNYGSAWNVCFCSCLCSRKKKTWIHTNQSRVCFHALNAVLLSYKIKMLVKKIMSKTI